MNTIFYNNPVRAWIYAAAVFIAAYLLIQLIRKFSFRKLSVLTARTVSEWDDLIPQLINRFNVVTCFMISLYAVIWLLKLPEAVRDTFEKALVVVLLAQIAIWGSHAINHWLSMYRKAQIERNAGAVTTISAVAFILQVLLWTIILLLTLANLGVNVTALVTGLGVGGIAVALAVQNILGDLFASFSIVLDKPFVIGDFIIVDSYLGTIEKVGIKTTRIRSLSGEQLIFSNTDLLRSRIRNYKRMYERRVVFALGVVYQTPPEHLDAIPGMVREIIESLEKTRFDRAHFKEFGAYALNFEIVYYVLDPDYTIYMNIQQAINMAIYRQFKAQGIEFAYPTQTLFHVNPETTSAPAAPEA